VHLLTEVGCCCIWCAVSGALYLVPLYLVPLYLVPLHLVHLRRSGISWVKTSVYPSCVMEHGLHEPLVTGSGSIRLRKSELQDLQPAKWRCG
jgi:hypothetical protein